MLLCLTWNSSEEFNSVSVAVEAELSVCHGAVRYVRARHRTIHSVIAVHSHRATWTTGDRSYSLMSCWGKKTMFNHKCLERLIEHQRQYLAEQMPVKFNCEIIGRYSLKQILARCRFTVDQPRKMEKQSRERKV